MVISPILPIDIHGNLNTELLQLSEKVCINSAKLASGYHPMIIDSIKNLLRITNSYYSNRIEAQSTHPIDIEKAMKKEFSSDSKEKSLQELSLAHIQTQYYIENYCNEEQNVISREFIKSIHKQFYSADGMESFREVHSVDEIILFESGEFRDRKVQVGKHIAPSEDMIESIFNYFEKEYSSLYKNNTKALKLLAALSSHHRLTYIHPFLDGNGRVSRLFLDAMCFYMDLEGYGIWNISRGLARDVKEYQNALSYADMKQQGSIDGRGELSLRGLEGYLKYMLEVALDQIDFMEKNLQLSTLNERVKSFVRFSQSGMYNTKPLPKYSEYLLSELLLCGELERGEVEKIISKSKRTATELIRELLDMEYIKSDTPRGKIRLHFNSFFASKIIPDLIPEKHGSF